MSEKVVEEEKKRVVRPFPKHTLQEALKVVEAIQNKNNGNPMKTVFLAQSLDLSPTSTNFRDITSSAYKYGLTQGTWNVDKVALTPLGNALTKPTDPKKEVKDRQEAVMKIDLYKSVYEHYRDGKFPSAGDSYFKNVLEDTFKVPREYVEECIKILEENGRFASILTETKGGLFVVFSEEPLPEPTPAPPEIGEGEKLPEPQIPRIPEPTPTTPVFNQIFIVHGKDVTPVEQLKKILLEFKIPFKVAVDEPHVGRPISQKVSELMKSCTSAIVIFTADEEYADAKGNKLYRPSDNAVYELGAASILYGDKIVILKEEGVSLASDFSDLGHITFKKDELDAKSMELIKELIGFGLLKFTTA
jgi:hypothetical protein